MSGLMGRSVRCFYLVKAARELRQEIEKAGLDDCKILANAGISIVTTYLNRCPLLERAKRRQELNSLVQMGITPDMILTELARQNPDLAPIMQGKEDYKNSEVQNLEQFLREG